HVVRDEDGGRLFLEQLQSNLISRITAVVTGANQRIVQRNVCLAQRFLVPLEAAVGCTHARNTTNKPDTAMAKLNKVLRGKIASTGIVDQDSVRFELFAFAVEEDDRSAAHFQHSQQ